MNQQTPPENSQRKRPNLTLSSEVALEDVALRDTVGSLDSTTNSTNSKGEDEDLLPLITIKNSTGERTSESLTTTSALSFTNTPSSPSAGLVSPNPYNGTPNVLNRFDFNIEETVPDFSKFKRPERDIGEVLPSLSKTLTNSINSLDPDGTLRQKTMQSKTLTSKGLRSTFSEVIETDTGVEELQQPQLSGFKILTQQEIQQEHASRSPEEKEFNISDSTIAKLQDIAQSNEIVIITRPVNSTALTLIKQDAVGKNMFVHGKSAAGDSLAEGLITVNAGSSKAGRDDNADKIKAYNAENHESLKKSEELFELVQAKLQEAAPHRRLRLQKELEDLSKKSEPTEKEIKDKAEIEKELKEGPAPGKLLQEAKIPEEYFDQMVFAAPVLDKKGNQIYVFQDNLGKVRREDGIQVHAVEEGGKLYFIDKNHEHKAISPEIPAGYTKFPLQVIGKPEITIGKDGSLNIGKVKPITADIDVLAYGAKVNLQEFDKMPSYYEMVAAEKEQLLKGSTLQLTEETRRTLINNNIDDVLRGSGVIPDSLKQDKKFVELAKSFKSVEVQRENLKGMGSAPEAVTAITGAMRAEFKDSVEISHNSEQFNIGFTQELDNKWVLIHTQKDPSGDKTKDQNIIKTIRGEKELLETFNHFKAKGLSMPPNPNWGWELKEGKYEKNKDLVDINAYCQHLSLKKHTLNEDKAKATGEEKDKIESDIQIVSNILKLQTEAGLMAMIEPRDNEKFAEHVRNLREQIKKCRKQEIITLDDAKQIKQYRESRAKIYEPQETVGREFEPRKSDISTVSTSPQIGGALEIKPVQPLDSFGSSKGFKKPPSPTGTPPPLRPVNPRQSQPVQIESIEKEESFSKRIVETDPLVSDSTATVQTINTTKDPILQRFNSPSLPRLESAQIKLQSSVGIKWQDPSLELLIEQVKHATEQHSRHLPPTGHQLTTEVAHDYTDVTSTTQPFTTQRKTNRLSAAIEWASENSDINEQATRIAANLGAGRTQLPTISSRSSPPPLPKRTTRVINGRG